MFAFGEAGFGRGENESLQSFITRFNKEALSMNEVDDKLLLAAFHKGDRKSTRLNSSHI